jgi:hypothetical protein
LKEQIRISEGGEDKADLSLVEMKLFFEYIGSGADVYPVYVGQEIHQTQQKKDDITRRK